MNYPLTLAAPQISQPESLPLGRFVQALRRRMWLVVLCAILGGAAAFAFSLTLPKRYTASTALVLDAQHVALPELQGVLRENADADPMLLVRTELQALSSRQLVGEVADELHLDRLKEFNLGLAAPSMSDVAIGDLRRWIGVTPTASSATSVREGVISEALRHLSVFNDNRSMVVTVSFVSLDPQLSADFVNSLTRHYREDGIAQRGQANDAANAALVGRIDQLNGEIAGLQKQASDLRDKSQYIGLRAGSVGQQQLEDLATEAAQASLARAQAQANWERANDLAKRGASDQIAGVLSSDTISHLREQQAQAARRYAELSARYGTGYPGVRDAQANLASVNGLLGGEVRRIVDSLQAQLVIARQHETDAQQQLAQAREAAVKNTGVQTRLDDLTQEIQARRSLVQSLQVSMQQTLRQPGGDTPGIRVLSPAEPPVSASSPQPKLASVFGLAGGGVLGVLLALVTTGGAALADATSRTAGGLPVLAVLPRISRRSQLLSPASGAMLPTGSVAEALRTLRLRVRASAKASAPRVVLFIPVTKTENGASVAFAFARLAAGDGERVLLIEGSLQAPVLSRLLKIQGDGLAEVFERGLHWREALAHDTQSSLDLLLADGLEPNAQQLLTGMKFRNVLVEAREDYNLIVLSAPSAKMTANALALATCADATVLIFDGDAGKSNGVGRFVDDLLVTSAGSVSAMVAQFG